MITDTQVEQALDWLRDTAETGAKWSARRTYLEKRLTFIMDAKLRAIKARVMKEKAKEFPAVNAQEREAYASEEYQDAVSELELITQELEEAVREQEYHRAMRAAAEAKIEAWRTMAANNRAQGRMV